MSRFLTQAYLIPRLGVRHVLAVLQYRARSKRGYYEARLPARTVVHPQAFWEGNADASPATATPALLAAIRARADEICAGRFRRFTTQVVEEGELPVWFKGVYAASSLQHFSRVPVNAVAGEDVKLTWDLSRCHWAAELALAAAVTEGGQRERYLARLHALTTRWLSENGYQRGANWACAHEVAVRGMQLMLASILLLRHVGLRPSPQLLDLMQQSWRRVDAVRAYGRAQQNNHSLAEHLFLIYAAEFLAQQGIEVADAATRTTRKQQLAPLMGRLVLQDGGCNMYSTNYHRVFCDMVSFAKLFDDAFGVGLFAAPELQHHAAGLARFLRAIIEPVSGEAPLIGHNDGSLHALQYAPFHQFEPSLLLLSALFNLPVPERARRNLDAVWLFGHAPKFVPTQDVASEQQFDDSGLLIVDRAAYRAYVKYPRCRFRPQQIDFLHLDLWVGGQQMLRDSGTYSYNAATRTRADGLGASHAHSMPVLIDGEWLQKLSPFLYAFWPDTTVRKLADGEWDFRFHNGANIAAERHIMFEAARITLTDYVAGSALWGVAFNGVLEEGKQDMTATLGNAARVTFSNLQHVSLADANYAPNYGSHETGKRLIAEPADLGAPLTTRITIGG